MAELVHIPLQSLEHDTLQALLEEYATRDGTDYGLHETELPARCRQLLEQLEDGRLMLFYDLGSQTWDLLDRERARTLLQAHGE